MAKYDVIFQNLDAIYPTNLRSVTNFDALNRRRGYGTYIVFTRRETTDPSLPRV